MEMGRNIKARNTEQTPSLPQELIEEIMSKLPVKSVFKFKLVSKSWLHTMSDKRFIETHLQNSSKNPKVLLIPKEPSSSQPELSQISLLSLFNDTVLDPPQWINTNDLKSNICLKSITLVGCCNGLVCIMLNDKHFMLWNPSTRASKRLPPPKDGTCRYYCCGFGHNKQSDDYVILCYFWHIGEAACKLYSLKNDSWKKIDSDFTPVCPGLRGILVSGKFHWARFMEKHGIIAFDFNTETFETFKQPLDNPPHLWPNLGILGECLSVLYANEYRVDVWVMNEYGVRDSWEKVMAVDNLGFGPSFSLFCIGGEGEIMLMQDGQFFIYRRRLDGSGYERVRVLKGQRSGEAQIYSESLVSLSP